MIGTIEQMAKGAVVQTCDGENCFVCGRALDEGKTYGTKKGYEVHVGDCLRDYLEHEDEI